MDIKDIKILPKKFLIIIIILIIIILALGIWLGIKFFNYSNSESPSEYAAVYLKTGEIYFGKLDFFPWPKLKNVWFLRQAVDSQNQSQLGILPFKNIFWEPIDKIYLNPSEIVFWTYLRKNSQLVEAFRSPNFLSQPSLSVQNFNQTSTNLESENKKEKK